MNWNLFFVALAVGSISELIFLSAETDNLKKTVMVVRVCGGALLLAWLVPAEGATGAALIGTAGIPFIGRVIGESLERVYQWRVIRKETREWLTNRKSEDEKVGSTLMKHRPILRKQETGSMK